jgi:hypothetical protein
MLLNIQEAGNDHEAMRVAVLFTSAVASVGKAGSA